MRILVVTHEYPPVGGGGGQAARDLALGLARRGHEIKVLTTGVQALPAHSWDGMVEIMRVPTGRKQAFKASLRDMAVFVLAGGWRGVHLARAWQPDVIHAHFAVPGGALGWLLSHVGNVPLVLTAHLGDVPGGVPDKTGRWFRWIGPWTPFIWKRAARVIAVSDWTRELARAHYAVPIDVIPNGVALNHTGADALEIGTPPQIVFAGRFVQQKNPVRLVRVLAALRDQPWHCTMIGDGPLRGAVEQAIAEHDLGDRCSLPGWIDPAHVQQRFAHGDLLFMPSLSEGLPVVGVQALAAGLAIVASRVGGFVDLVADGANGYLLAPDDEPGMIAALAALLNDSARLREFRRVSRARAARFDIDAVVAAYAAVFSEVEAQ